jgi:hypothetical protein
MDHRQALNLLLAAVLSPSGVALGSDTSSESKEVLKRAAARIAANYHSIHSYTCLETVQRRDNILSRKTNSAGSP